MIIYYNNSDSLIKIQQITRKNQAKKIINAYKKYRDSQSFSQKTNEILTNYDIPQDKIDYIGRYDSRGNKSGFGIQKLEDGSIFKA